MDKQETDNFFNWLKLFFPNMKRLDDKHLQSAWLQLLRPYSSETVKDAVIDHLRESTNFPDPQKIAVRCQAIEPAPEKRAASLPSRQDCARVLPYTRKLAAKISREDFEEIHAAGLLTWEEAEARGEDFAAWNRKYREKFPIAAKGNRV